MCCRHNQIQAYADIIKWKRWYQTQRAWRVFGITFITYTQSHNIWKPNNAKIFWSKKTKDQREQPKSAKANHGRGWSTLVLIIITLVKKGRFGLLLIDWLIYCCLTPTLAIFQLYRGVNKFLISLRHLHDP